MDDLLATNGRPPKQDRRVWVQFRVTAMEKLALRRLANTRKMSIGQLLDNFAAKRQA